MVSEFVKLTGIEIEYGDRNLLHSQLELLSMVKRYKTFHDLRKREFSLKIKIKNLLKEAKTELAELEKVLPKIKLEEEKVIEVTLPRNPPKMTESIKKSDNKERESKLDTEIEEIKRKLSSLQE